MERRGGREREKKRVNGGWGRKESKQSYPHFPHQGEEEDEKGAEKAAGCSSRNKAVKKIATIADWGGKQEERGISPLA